MGCTPIARAVYRFIAATGYDDLLLVEGDSRLATAIALVSRRAIDAGGAPLDAALLPVGDVDALVSELRGEALGDRMIAEGRCPACSAPIDVQFSLQAFREHRRPRSARGATPAAQPGWWELARHETAFRLPTAGDVVAVAEAEDPAVELAARCVRGAGGRATVRAAERAMARMAPTLCDEVQGRCADCAATVTLDVDVRELCLQELRFLACGVLEDVHVLASAYGWDEQRILELPVRRRAAYAEMVRAADGAPISAEAFGG